VVNGTRKSWLSQYVGRKDRVVDAGALTRPENQVTPFHITTNDNEELFAWLIAPLGVYAEYAEAFITEHAGVDDIQEKLAFKLLRDDPDARLLLYFHGNSATIAQRRRTEEYRSYASGASDKIFVLAFDYRGFGRSSGTPSETGLLNDAEAVVDWALNTARIPPDRIVLLGHSLGTSVVAGIAHHYAKLGIEFAGLILCAAFTNAGNAFASYSIGGVVPVLAPVKMSSHFQSWFSRRMRDTWHSDNRLADLARKLLVYVVRRITLRLQRGREAQTTFTNDPRAALHFR
jgi:pimeloyl-ACP methyl ester carboxylesterase